MKIYVIVFVSVFLSQACKMGIDNGKFENTEEIESDTIGQTGLRFLALGDSYTIGQNVTVAERWPVILAKDLAQLNIKVRNPEIIATTGWTTANLLSRLSNYNPTQTFDMVSLLIGVNNQFQEQSIETYKNEFRALLTKSVAYTGGRREKVFVLSIPDWGVSQYAAGYNRSKIAQEIDQFNAVAKEECLKEKILFINITDISRQALNDPTMLANDGLHFSGKMHKLWVDAVIPQIKPGM